MNKIICTILLVLLAVGSVASAADKMLYDSKSKPAVPIQNLTALAPMKSHSGCVTQTVTKGVFDRYSVATGYIGNESQVVDSAGAGVSVKWYLDGVLAWIGSTFSFTNPGGNTYSRKTFQPYSAAPRSLSSCTKSQ